MHAQILQSQGFRLQDLGVNHRDREAFYHFDGTTFAVDDEGYTWTKQGLVDPGDFFRFEPKLLLWQPVWEGYA